MRKLSVLFVMAACAAAAFVSCERKNTDPDKNPYEWHNLLRFL